LFFGPTVARAQSACLPTSERALDLRSWLRELVTSTDPTDVRVRTALGFPAMDSLKVVNVTSNTVCNNVAKGWNTTQKTTYARQLHVVKVGSFYAAKDPAHPAGEWDPTASFNGKYKLLTLILAP
jgi:hypothetical protein